MHVWRFVGGSFVVLALFSCGSHNHATVAYDTEAAQRERIFNTPHELYRSQESVKRASQIPPGPIARVATKSEIETAQLRPIAIAYAGENGQGAPVRYAKTARASDRVIQITAGDTVYALSRRYGPSPQAIIAANDLTPPYTLSIGQLIRIPAIEGKTIAAAPQRKTVARDTIYTVQPGDTLYSIARQSKTPVNTIAQVNGIARPYTISIGQQLLVPQAKFDDKLYAMPSGTNISGKIANNKNEPKDVAQLTRSVSYTPPPTSADSKFRWPVRGAIVSQFGSRDLGRRNDGVNIAAPAGTPVRAAADGDVVYSGSELDGFGNLLLVKHAGGYVTAYAHNDAMLVKKGDTVRQGQVIAKVGQTGSVSSPQLHFEVRQNLKSVDPVVLLGSQ